MQTITNPTTVDTAVIAERRLTQHIEDLVRLGKKAEAEGCWILVDYRTGGHIATSRSDRSAYHTVSPEACSCRGHAFWGKCGHRGLLLMQLGIIGDTQPACPHCEGTGFDPECHGHQVNGRTITCECPVCVDAVDVDWEPDGWRDRFSGDLVDDLPPAA